MKLTQMESRFSMKEKMKIKNIMKIIKVITNSTVMMINYLLQILNKQEDP